MEEPDKTIATLLSAQTIGNTSHQVRINNKYLIMLQNGDYEGLEKEIIENSELLKAMHSEAKSLCSVMECTDEQITYIQEAVSRSELLPFEDVEKIGNK
jgi:hypothetical protein